MNRRLALPAAVHELVERQPATVLLEGGKQSPSEGSERPWTRLFTAPLRVFTAWQPAEIPALFAEIDRAVAAGLNAAGFFSYECGLCFEPKAGLCASREGQPLAWFGIYERSYAFDHSRGVFGDGEPPELERLLRSPKTLDEEAVTAPLADADFALKEGEYTRRIAAIHELIRAGDVYQLNFTAPFRVETHGSSAALYARLRARQPVDYGAFLHWQQGRHILSFSPELFFRIEPDSSGNPSGRRIITRPMKGTAPRGRTTREDREIAAWLRSDPKNRSENVMIVDLLRNDLGRVAQTGTVRVERLFEVERYRTLWQMTSTVSAELRPETDFYEIFRALFPSGSVTGAPKVRAMQLIAALEGAPRGVYTGAIGFFSPSETVFNVAIRTIELEDGRGIMGVGSGIVIDSDPVAEFRECLLKAEFLTHTADQRPERLSLIETLLWNGTYPLLELHLDRLADSAAYFDFSCDCAAIQSALEDLARCFAAESKPSPRRVRLLLASCGSFEITSEILGAASDANRIARARIAPQRTDSADPMLFHKTTHRPLYALAIAQAVDEGFDDVLFLNLRGEVTEGAISNIFIVKDGHWSTPPIACGLLAGVYRRHLLATRPEIEERVLNLDNLREADAVYLCNAVRGLRRAQIEW
jgi:para-aminobenzoate synthetase/4-amino-4-deoxychorismate lyase